MQERSTSTTRTIELEQKIRAHEEKLLLTANSNSNLTHANASLQKEIDTLKEFLQGLDGLSSEQEHIQIVTQQMHQMLDDEERRKKRKFGEGPPSSPSLSPEFARPSAKYKIEMEAGPFKIPCQTEEKVDVASQPPSDSVSSSFESPSPMNPGKRKASHVESSSFSPISSILTKVSQFFSPRAPPRS